MQQNRTKVKQEPSGIAAASSASDLDGECLGVSETQARAQTLKDRKPLLVTAEHLAGTFKTQLEQLLPTDATEDTDLLQAQAKAR